MFLGNINDNSVKKNDLPYPIVARYIRINPQRWSRFISMRVEFYGCRFGRSPCTDFLSINPVLQLWAEKLHSDSTFASTENRSETPCLSAHHLELALSALRPLHLSVPVSDTFCRHLRTLYCLHAFQSTKPLSSCRSDSAFADHCARL